MLKDEQWFWISIGFCLATAAYAFCVFGSELLFAQ